ncbi:MAG: IS110 family transposase, partial [Bacteroidota bacterium]
DLCAKSAIQHDKQLKAYYQGKVTQGKPKMSVINAVRNKIMVRVFAVVKRKSPFVDTYKFAA